MKNQFNKKFAYLKAVLLILIILAVVYINLKAFRSSMPTMIIPTLIGTILFLIMFNFKKFLKN